jgi:hypothetical protein
MKKDYRISKASVEGMSDADYFWALIEPIWPDSSVEDELEHISYGTPGQRALYATTLFMREVDNGGIEQFFWNSSSLYCYEVLEGFKLLGMTEYYETLNKALTFFPDSKVPSDWIERQKYIDNRKDEIKSFFEPLNDVIYGEERLYPYFHKYVETHPKDFFIENENNS